MTWMNVEYPKLKAFETDLRTLSLFPAHEWRMCSFVERTIASIDRFDVPTTQLRVDTVR